MQPPLQFEEKFQMRKIQLLKYALLLNILSENKHISSSAEPTQEIVPFREAVLELDDNLETIFSQINDAQTYGRIKQVNKHWKAIADYHLNNYDKHLLKILKAKDVMEMLDTLFRYAELSVDISQLYYISNRYVEDVPVELQIPGLANMILMRNDLNNIPPILSLKDWEEMEVFGPYYIVLVFRFISLGDLRETFLDYYKSFGRDSTPLKTFCTSDSEIIGYLGAQIAYYEARFGKTDEKLKNQDEQHEESLELSSKEQLTSEQEAYAQHIKKMKKRLACIERRKPYQFNNIFNFDSELIRLGLKLTEEDLNKWNDEFSQISWFQQIARGEEPFQDPNFWMDLTSENLAHIQQVIGNALQSQKKHQEFFSQIEDWPHRGKHIFFIDSFNLMLRNLLIQFLLHTQENPMEDISLQKELATYRYQWVELFFDLSAARFPLFTDWIPAEDYKLFTSVYVNMAEITEDKALQKDCYEKALKLCNQYLHRFQIENIKLMSDNPAMLIPDAGLVKIRDEVIGQLEGLSKQ